MEDVVAVLCDTDVAETLACGIRPSLKRRTHMCNNLYSSMVICVLCLASCFPERFDGCFWAFMKPHKVYSESRTRNVKIATTTVDSPPKI